MTYAPRPAAGDEAELRRLADELFITTDGADLWETWGNYRLSCRRVAERWRLDGFRYYSKLTRGNDAVRTHTA